MTFDTGSGGKMEGSARGEMFDLTLESVESIRRGMLRGIGALMILKGSVDLELNGVNHILNADDIVVVNNRDIYSISSDSSNIALTLRIFETFLERECSEILNFRYDCNSAASDEYRAERNKFFNAKRSLIRMMLAHYKRDDGYSLEIKRAMMDLLHSIYTNFRVFPAAPSRQTEGSPQYDAGGIREAVSYIHENYHGDVSLDSAASSVGMSPQYFSRRFKQKMGMGFLEYLNKIRLDSAVRDLLRTNESILRIAVNNGFAGSKPFTTLFKKIYGQTPQSYKLKERERRAQSSQSVNPVLDRGSLSIGTRETFDNLLKYVAIYDINHGYRARASEPISVSLKPAASPDAPYEPHSSGDAAKPGLSLPGKIFKIGRLSEAADEEQRNQLAAAQKKLRGDYIYFQGVFGDGLPAHPDGSYFKSYGHGQIFGYFMELGLTPFVLVDLSIADRAVGASVSEFLDVMLEHRPVTAWRKGIRIEAAHSGGMSAAAFASGFREVYLAAKRRSPRIGVGFHSVSSRRPEEWAGFGEKLSSCVEAGCEPDFLSITIDPSIDADYRACSAGDESSYRSIKNYGPSQIEALRRASSEITGRAPEIYVTEWNTLSGRTPIESSTFFRAALISSELMAYGERVSAAAYWLNSKSKEMLTGKVENRVLALFFYGSVRRPLYYLLSMMNRLGDRVVFRSDKLIVTSAGEGEYAAMIVNPCYFDPLYSVEESYVAMESIRVEARLSGIPRGRYRFKVFIFEKKHSSAFDRLSRVGLMSIDDEDTADYLERAILPEFNIFEDDIDSAYTLAPELGYNGVALYLFKRIG
jgi:AraC-like DNA-binding protein